MLRKLRLHNFKTFLNAEINFTQRHLLIGKNNSGKTNVCSALRFLGATALNDLATSASAVPGGIDEIRNWWSRSTETELSCTCELPFNDELFDFTYTLRMKPDVSPDPAEQGRKVLRVVQEQLLIRGPGFSDVPLLDSDGREARMLHEEDHVKGGGQHSPETTAPRDATMLSKLYELPTNRRMILFRKYLAVWTYYALSPEHMRYGWRELPPMWPNVVPRGDNLATAIYHLKNMDERRYRQVIEHTRIVEPDLEAINFIPAPDQPPVPFVVLRGQPRASWGGLSDGTLRCLGLATVIEHVGAWCANVESPPPMVTIEEPENGIYPGQLRKVFDLFEERAPAGQFIFTSHSPYFINLFDGLRDSVTILRRNAERTEIVPVPPAEDDPDRLPLADQYSMELIG